MFAGQMLQHVTAGRFPAAMHRVVSSHISESAACSEVRGSVQQDLSNMPHSALQAAQRRPTRLTNPVMGLQVCAEPRVSLCYKLRAVGHGIIDLRSVPGFVPSDRCRTQMALPIPMPQSFAASLRNHMTSDD